MWPEGEAGFDCRRTLRTGCMGRKPKKPNVKDHRFPPSSGKASALFGSAGFLRLAALAFSARSGRRRAVIRRCGWKTVHNTSEWTSGWLKRPQRETRDRGGEAKRHRFWRHLTREGSTLQRCHPFAEQPKRLVEFDILVDAVDGTRLYTARPSKSSRQTPRKPPLMAFS